MRSLLFGLFVMFLMLVPCTAPGQLDRGTLSLLEQSAQYRLGDLMEFLSLPNDAYQPEQLEPNIQWAEQAFAEVGFTTQRLQTDGIELLFAERQTPGAQKTILFYVQIDGQPVDPTRWDQSDPFQPVVKQQTPDGNWEIIPTSVLEGPLDPDWRIYARSAADAKGPIVMFLAALWVADATGTAPAFNIKVIMDTEEEIGSPHLPAAVEVHRELLAADGLIILDGPMHPSNQPTLTFGARGITTLRITTYGPRVPQHSGHYGNYVPNPALHLSKLLSSMKDYQGRVLIPGFYDGIEISEATRHQLEAVPDDASAMQLAIGFAQPDSVAGSLQEALQYPSLNIRGMQAAWVGSKVRTIIPQAAVANLDIRTVLESDPARLVELVRRHIIAQGFHLCEQEPTDEERATYPLLASMSHRIAYQAFRTDPESEIGQWLAQALEQAHGRAPIQIRTFGGSIPIAPFVRTLDIPAVIVPLVNADNNQHSPNENLRLGNYLNSVRTCYAILTEVW